WDGPRPLVWSDGRNRPAQPGHPDADRPPRRPGGRWVGRGAEPRPAESFRRFGQPSAGLIDRGPTRVLECRDASPVSAGRVPTCPGAGGEDAMAITYYKRFRMEIDLDGSLPPPRLSPPFYWIAWEESLIDRHAEVKYLSFRGEIDASVFPCLGERPGCQ